MYSFFDYEDIEITDLEGLKEFFKIWEEEYPDSLKEKDMLSCNSKGKSYISFEEWDNIKLISYYYPEDLIFLKGIAKYIEGTVSWTFETKDEAGEVKFKNGECIIEAGRMDWKSYKPEELGSKELKLKPKLKRLLMIDNLK